MNTTKTAEELAAMLELRKEPSQYRTKRVYKTPYTIRFTEREDLEIHDDRKWESLVLTLNCMATYDHAKLFVAKLMLGEEV